MKDIVISVVIPIYKSEKMLEELVAAIQTELIKVSGDCEILLVEDGSPDNSWETIEGICKKHSNVRGVKLSRNFGQHNAITAGLEHSRGQWVVVMDCDFQDNPEYIPVFYAEALKGNDIVFGKRQKRQDNFIKRSFSKLFYKLFAYLTDSDFDGSVINFGIYNRKVINAVLSMKEPFKFFVLMSRWVGFKSTSVDVKHNARKEGKSSYTFSKLLNLGFMILLTYSQKPLILTIRMGLLISFMSVFFIGYNIVMYYSGKIVVLGYSTIIASIWLIGGIIIFILGILGLYLGKAFEGIKNRPVFIVDKVIN